MVISKEELVQKEKKNTPKNKNEQLKSKNTFKTSLLPTVAVLVALVAVTIAVCALFLNKQLYTQLTHTNTAVAEKLKQLAQEQSDALKQINTKNQQTEAVQIQLQATFDALSKQLQTVMNQRFYQNQDWILLKVRYYLELAQINAHWSHNSEPTITLLEQADHLLKQFSEPAIFTIRQAIANDIAKIQAIPRVDIIGLLSQLDAIQNSINNLKITALKPTMEQPKISPSSSWNMHLQDSIGFLGKLIVIRRQTQEIKPLLSPLLDALLKESLRLNLQEAQWAVLNHDVFVYKLTIKQAINTLKINFNEHTSNASSVIKTLTQLQQMDVTQKKPVLGSALPMLNQLIESKKIPSSQEQGGNQS